MWAKPFVRCLRARRAYSRLLCIAACLGFTLQAWGDIALSLPYRAIISDVDCTLMPFATNTELSSRNRAALASAIKAGCQVCVATGRIPGPWYEDLLQQLPGLGPGVFANGALVLAADSDVVLQASSLPAEAVARVVQSSQGGIIAGHRVALLALLKSDKGYGYAELAPEPTWVTQMIQRAAEPVKNMPSFDDLPSEVYKFVLFTSPDVAGWADDMAPVTAALEDALADTGVRVLDCGRHHCEVLPPGVNKGTGVRQLLAALGSLAFPLVPTGNIPGRSETTQASISVCAGPQQSPQHHPCNRLAEA
ncbi:unnamed protein product [Effrenium voratum]|nr:unnamed protein product [Effrenium voratum]